MNLFPWLEGPTSVYMYNPARAKMHGDGPSTDAAAHPVEHRCRMQGDPFMGHQYNILLIRSLKSARHPDSSIEERFDQAYQYDNLKIVE